MTHPAREATITLRDAAGNEIGTFPVTYQITETAPAVPDLRWVSASYSFTVPVAEFRWGRLTLAEAGRRAQRRLGIRA
jgi:hypothetical protein